MMRQQARASFATPSPETVGLTPRRGHRAPGLQQSGRYSGVVKLPIDNPHQLDKTKSSNNNRLERAQNNGNSHL